MALRGRSALLASRPRLESHFEWKLILGYCFVLDSRAAPRTYQPPFSEILSEWEVISNGPPQTVVINIHEAGHHTPML